MTTLQLGQRILRRLTPATLADLSPDHATEILDAATDAIAEYHSLAPSSRIPVPASKKVNAPFTAAVTVTAGSATMTGPAVFPGSPAATTIADVIGSTIIIPGDGQLNRILSATALLKPCFASSGVKTATIYGDALSFGVDDMRIVTPPRWTSPTVAVSQPLLYLGAPRDRWPEYPMIPVTGENEASIGQPSWWWTEPMPVSTALTPPWQLRVWPLPSTQGALAFTLDSWFAALVFDDLQVAREIPIPEREMPALINLIHARLVGSTLWRDGADKTATLADAQRARKTIGALDMPTHSQPALVGTRQGF